MSSVMVAWQLTECYGDFGVLNSIVAFLYHVKRIMSLVLVTDWAKIQTHWAIIWPEMEKHVCAIFLWWEVYIYMYVCICLYMMMMIVGENEDWFITIASGEMG